MKRYLFLVMVMLAGVGYAFAAEKSAKPKEEVAERKEDMRRRPQDRTAGRERFGRWFEELTEAYEQNDRDKMGQLLEDMKERRQQFRRERGRADRSERASEDKRPARRPAASSVESPKIPKRDEKRILGVLEDMESQRSGMYNVPLEDGRLLRVLAEAVGAKRVVEVGTSNGYLGIWLCLGLQATGGKLITHEIDPERAALARKNFKRAGVEDMVTLVEGDAHEQVTKVKGPVDIVFLDADKSGYVDYLEKLLPLVRPGGLILAHNMSRPEPDPRYIEAVTKDPKLETIFVHMDDAGMGVTVKKR